MGRILVVLVLSVRAWKMAQGCGVEKKTSVAPKVAPVMMFPRELLKIPPHKTTRSKLP